MTATMPDTIRLTGQMLIAGSPVRGSGTPIHGFNPSTGQQLEPAYHYGDQSHVDAACAAAAAAFAVYRSTTSEQRARFLEAIAANIEAIRDDIIARAVAESGLPEARITGEVGRTTGQLRLFAERLARRQLERRPHRSCTSRPDPVCHAPTFASAPSRSAPSPSSVQATSRWPSPSPVATPHRRWPPDAPSSSRRMTRTPAPPNSSAAPSPRPSPTPGCPPAPSRCCSGPGPSSASRS